jgi:DNA-binding FadR family transcriptional regulator
MLQRHAARPSDNLKLHQAVCQSILERRPEDAARDMEALLVESRTWLLPYTTGHMGQSS